MGDCTFGKDPDFPDATSFNAFYAANGPAYFFADVLPYTSADNLTIANCEGAFTESNDIQEKAFKNPKLHFMWDTVVDELLGEDILSGMIVKNTKTGELTRIDADEEDGLFGLFGFIGYNPRSELFEGMLDMDHGYIKTDDNMHTNIPGVFAAGDIRVKALRQVVTAAADGAIAAMQAEKYVSEHEN